MDQAKDRSGTYKTKPRGIGDRLVRGIRVQKGQKQSRTDEIAQRRRMPLMPLATIQGENDGFITEDTNKKRETNEKPTNVVDQRRLQLQKWLEEKKLKKKEEELNNKKKTFVVRHVSYSFNPSAVPASKLPAVKEAESARKTISRNEMKPGKGASNTAATLGQNGTRSSARLATRATKSISTSNKTKKQTTDVKSKKTSNSATSNSAASKAKKTVVPEKPAKCTRITTRSKAKAEPETATLQETSQEISQETSTLLVNKADDLVSLDSLIPSDFKFKAPTGMDSFSNLSTTFTFEPLSPSSAQRFMFSSRLESETENDSNVLQEAKECTSVACPSLVSPEGDKSTFVDSNTVADENKEDKGLQNTQSDNKEQLGSRSSYFRNLVETETNRLQGICALWGEDRNGDSIIPEEAEGMIRTVIGQVQLLVTKKFKQFKGLIDTSEDPNAERKTLTSDLQGFWDMIYFQVQDIDQKFQDLELLKSNNWEEKKEEVKRVIKKKNAKKATKKSNKVNAKAAENRNKFREMRAQMKAKLQDENCSQEPSESVLTPSKNKKPRIDVSDPSSECSDNAIATSSTENVGSLQKPKIRSLFQDHRQLPNVIIPSETDANAPATSMSDDSLECTKEIRSQSVGGSSRKRRRTKSKDRVKFACSPEDSSQTCRLNKRRGSPFCFRVPTPFRKGTPPRCTTDDDEVFNTNDKKMVKSDSGNSSGNENTGVERKNLPRRSSARKRLSSRKKRAGSHDVENTDFVMHLQPSSSESASEQDECFKTPNASPTHKVDRISRSELVTPTPSRLTMTPVCDSGFTPTLTEKSAHVPSSDTNIGTCAQAITPCVLLDNSHFNENDKNSEFADDSMIFPRENPCAQSSSEADVSATENLMFFSPTIPSKRGRQEKKRGSVRQEKKSCGSVRKFVPVTPSKKDELYLGTDAVFSPARRSARLEAHPAKIPNRPAFDSLSEVPDGIDYGYIPNKALVNL